MTERLLLASGSPRRADLLRSLGLNFLQVEPDVDELRRPGEEPHDYVERLARAKASACADLGLVVIGADTTVVMDGKVFGKPVHPDEATSMLRRLAGSTHEVLTGVAIARVKEEVEIVSAVESTLVRFLPMTEEEIVDYVATGEPMDKAGAYDLTGIGAMFVEAIHGSPSSVVGIPLHLVARLMRAIGHDLLSFR
ncbi:MAG: Maf family protein [Actinomycetota bacterium]